MLTPGHWPRDATEGKATRPWSNNTPTITDNTTSVERMQCGYLGLRLLSEPGAFSLSDIFPEEKTHRSQFISSSSSRAMQCSDIRYWGAISFLTHLFLRGSSFAEIYVFKFPTHDYVLDTGACAYIYKISQGFVIFVKLDKQPTYTMNQRTSIYRLLHNTHVMSCHWIRQMRDTQRERRGG